jgi:hypothetical protein
MRALGLALALALLSAPVFIRSQTDGRMSFAASASDGMTVFALPGAASNAHLTAAPVRLAKIEAIRRIPQMAVSRVAARSLPPHLVPVIEGDRNVADSVANGPVRQGDAVINEGYVTDVSMRAPPALSL